MKIWKVILATIVIFIAGAFAGGMVLKSRTPTPPVVPHESIPPILAQQRFQQKLKRELQLTGDVTNRIDKIFAESNPRIKIIWDLLNPEMQKELKEVRDSIRAELTPEQREKFEQMLKQPRRSDGRRGPRGTNGTNSATSPKWD